VSDLGVELELTTRETSLPIRNLYAPYRHDVAGYEHVPPNRHGVLTADDDARSWDEVLGADSAWWKQPGVLFPYLVRVDGVPAGFHLIATGAFVPTAGVDFVVHEFFVAHAWRGKGVAATAAEAGIARHRGNWEVVTWPTAPRAIAFWRKTLPACATGEVEETREADHPWGERVAFRFHNRSAGDRNDGTARTVVRCSSLPLDRAGP